MNLCYCAFFVFVCWFCFRLTAYLLFLAAFYGVSVCWFVDIFVCGVLWFWLLILVTLCDCVCLLVCFVDFGC